LNYRGVRKKTIEDNTDKVVYKMPASKNRRKNGKKKPQYKKKTIQMATVKHPSCMHCGTLTRLATQQELAEFSAHDPSFNQSFLFLPECDCWQQHEEWMTI